MKHVTNLPNDLSTLKLPALAAWRERAGRAPDGAGPRDALWRAATWEAAAERAIADDALPNTRAFVTTCLARSAAEWVPPSASREAAA